MSHITLRQLNIFIEVANQLSISGAARSLHLSQPGVSRQIQKLEIHTGNHLFEQFGKKLFLTESGKQLLMQAKKIIEHIDLFKTLCGGKDKSMQGTLKFSMSIPIQEMIFNILADFYDLYPFINFDILDGDTNTQLQLLRENKIDFCIKVNSIDKIELKNDFITHLPMIFFSSPRHRLANIKNITTKILTEETFIICEENSANYIKTHELFKIMKTNLPKKIQIKDQNAVKHAVKSNLGISILPRFMLELELKHKLLVPLTVHDFLNPITEIYWIQHVDKKLSSLAQEFKDFLFKVICNDLNKG